MNSHIADIDLAMEIGKDFCVKSRCFPVGRVENTWTFASECHDELLLESLRLRTGSDVALVEAASGAIEQQIKIIAGNQQNNNSGSLLSELEKSKLAVGDESSVDELREKSQAEPVVKLVNDIVEQAIAEGATDIHLEPNDFMVKVRYRKDGILQDSLELPRWVHAPLVSRIKILAELDIAEKRLPHDGRIRWNYLGDAIDMRISTLPTRMGEKVVIRILKHASYVSDLNALGLPSEILRSIKKIIHRPQGIFFVTGPTGSGKTSTLYAALQEILGKEINISTIEDPIEYRLNGANQVQVNEKAGLTFAGALRSLLRQDPDVILVGEIRDEETAAIAVQAAQTGHLVFSTLHTNDAVSALTRLFDLKIKPFLVSSAVLGILAQRLVRKVCPFCTSTAPPTPEELEFIPNLPDKCPAARGCEKCNQTGYSGRTGIFELLLVNSAIKDAILNRDSEESIKKLSGIKPLVLCGLDKIKSGITTPSELMRVAMSEG